MPFTSNKSLLETALQNTYRWLKKSLLVLGFVCCMISSALAEFEIQRIYEVELPLPAGGFDQTSVIKQAFKDMLVQVSGTRSVLVNSSIIAAIAAPDKYVTQFSYHASAQPTTPERSIKVSFNENLVDQLFTTTKLPIWDKKRPLTLIWLVVERDQKIAWLEGADSVAFIQALEQAFHKRCIPFALPLLDLVDTEIVSEQAIGNTTLEALEAASKRYHPDVILTGRLKHNTSWEGRWTLIQNHDPITFDTSAQALNAFADETAEKIATQLRTLPGKNDNQNPALTNMPNTGQVVVCIFGIANAEQYSQTIEYLRRLPAVDGVEVAEVASDKTIFHLQTSENQSNIAQTISEGRFLIEHTTFNVESDLAYTLIGAH